MQQNSHFEKIWSKQSARTIYVQNYIFFDNYTEIYHKEGKFLFSIPKPISAKHKITNVLLYELNSTHTLENYIVTLKQNGDMDRYSLESGRLLSHCSLNEGSESFQYNVLDWETSGERFYIKSKVNQKRQSFMILLFQAEPFKLLYKLECPKQVFGRSVRDVRLRDGVVFSFSPKNKILSYSLEQIIKMNEKTVTSSEQQLQYHQSENNYYSSYSLLHPITISTIPPSIYSTLSHNFFIEFGGYPYSIITSSSAGQFTVTPLNGDFIESGGNIHGIDYGMGEDPELYFYDNVEQQFLLRTPSSASSYSIVRSTGENKLILKKNFEFGSVPKANDVGSIYYKRPGKEEEQEESSSSGDENDSDNNNNNNNNSNNNNDDIEYYKTRFGRKIPIREQLSFNSIMHSVEYENELDVFIASVRRKCIIYDNIQLDRESSHDKPLRFHEIELLYNSKTFDHQRVLLDRDILIHLISNGGSHKVFVYKWQRSD